MVPRGVDGIHTDRVGPELCQVGDISRTVIFVDQWVGVFAFTTDGAGAIARKILWSRLDRARFMYGMLLTLICDTLNEADRRFSISNTLKASEETYNSVPLVL